MREAEAQPGRPHARSPSDTPWTLLSVCSDVRCFFRLKQPKFVLRCVQLMVGLACPIGSKVIQRVCKG